MAPRSQGYKLKIEVWLKEGLVDAEGKTLEEALVDLGFPIESAKAGRVYEIILNVESREEAGEEAERMCDKLLANPVKDRCVVDIIE